jgi:hypothetical protein
MAAAQNASDTKAAADALFDEGKRLLAAGDVDHACPKFEASLQLLEQLGVRLNLADCHERQGRTATAWAEFREAASQADKHGDARAAYARQRTEALTPRLVKLQISVAPANQLPDLVVRRDGKAVPSNAFGVPLPVDRGSYTIDASAPGYLGWSTHVDLKKPGEVVTVEVPRLAAAPAKVEPPKPSAPNEAVPAASPQVQKQPDEPASVDPTARHRRYVLALGVGAGGVAAVGVGVVLGLEARSKWGSVGMHCDANHVCDATGASINHDARLLGNVGTIVGSVGVAALITGTVLYLTAPAARPVIEHARLDVDRSSGVRIGFEGRF